jgi:ABC-type multidrug transport system fused ATPase/permease subunit
MTGILRQLAFLYQFPLRYRRALVVSQSWLLASMLLAIAIPIIIRQAIDLGIVGQDALVLFGASLATVAVGFVTVALNHFGKRRRFIVASKVVTDVRRALMSKILELSPAELKESTGGQALTRLSSDATALRGVTNGGLLELANQAIVAIATFAVSALLDWRITVLAVIPMIVVGVLSLGVQQRLKQLFAEVREHFTTLLAGVSESLAGIQVIKAFGREQERAQRLSDVNQRLASRRRQMRVLYSVVMSGLNVVNALPPALVLWFGAQGVIAGTLTVGTLVAVMGLVMMLQMNVHMLTMGSNAIFQSTVTSERLARVLLQPPAVLENPDARPASRLGGRIEVTDAEVRVAGRPVLSHLDLEVRPGELLAVVGPTGSGKSALLALLARLADPASGSVRYDGVDGRDLEVGSLRRQVLALPQRPWLFEGTVAENIAFARPEAPAEDVARAAERAGLGGMDLERRVGVQGGNLSGGERQRVGLARALLVDPAVLLLDNPTANLDAETEARLERTILGLRGERTLVVATPHASFARHADRVIELAAGRVRKISPLMEATHGR